MSDFMVELACDHGKWKLKLFVTQGKGRLGEQQDSSARSCYVSQSERKLFDTYDAAYTVARRWAGRILRSGFNAVEIVNSLSGARFLADKSVTRLD